MIGLGDQFRYDLAAYLAQLLEAAAVEIGELGIVQAEQAEDGAVDVFDRMGDFDGLLANLVSGADDVASFDAAVGVFIDPSQNGRCGEGASFKCRNEAPLAYDGQP